MFITFLDVAQKINEQIDSYLYEHSFSLNELKKLIETRTITRDIKLNLKDFMTQRYKNDCALINSTLEKQAYKIQLNKDRIASHVSLTAGNAMNEYEKKTSKQQREARAHARIEYQITKQNINKTLSIEIKKILTENINRYYNALSKHYALLEKQSEQFFLDAFLTRLEQHISSLIVEEKELQREILAFIKQQKEYQTNERSLHDQKESINLLIAQLNNQQKFLEPLEKHNQQMHQLASLLIQNHHAIETYLIKYSLTLYYLKISSAFFAGITTLSSIPPLLIFTGVINNLTPLLQICLMALPTLFLLATFAIGVSALFYFCAIKNNQALIQENKINNEANQHALQENERLQQVQIHVIDGLKEHINTITKEHHTMSEILHEKEDNIKCIMTKLERNELSPLIFSSLFRPPKEEVSHDKYSTHAKLLK